MASKSRLIGLFCVLSVVVSPSCGSPFDGVARKLDEVARSIEEYGTISVSSPLLFRAEDAARFKFGLSRTAQEYYDDAKKVSGATAAFLQESVDTQFGASFRFNYNDYLKSRALISGYEEELAAYRMRQDAQSAAALLKALSVATSQPTDDPTLPSELLANQAKALAGLAEALPGPDSRPDFPDLPQNPPELESPLPKERPAQDALVDKKFKDFQALLEGRQLSHPSRAAIVTAAGDHLTQSILNFLVDPSEAAKFHGKRLYFAAMMVSVQPGDRTYRGYRADVSVRVGVGRVDTSAPVTKAMKEFTQSLSLLIAEVYKLNILVSRKKIQEALELRSNLMILDITIEKQAELMDKRINRTCLSIAKKDWEQLRRRWNECHNQLKDIEKLLRDLEISLNAFRASSGGRGVMLHPPDPINMLTPTSLDLRNMQQTERAALDFQYKLSKVSSGGTGSDDGDFIPEQTISPLVAAVSPMTDVQTLDLSSSIREQAAYAIRLATALSGMGANVQAEFFRDWVRRLERDSRTLTNLNAVTSYSVSGGVFGYQIAPRLQALADAAGKDPEPDMILQPITFPVLVIIGVDERDLEVYDIDAIAFEQTSRWLRAGHPRRDKRLFGRFFDRAGKPRLSEVDMMRGAYALDEASQEFTKISEERRTTHKRTHALLSNRIETLGFLTNAATTNWQTLDTIALENLPPVIRDHKGTVSGAGGATEVIKFFGERLSQLKRSTGDITVMPPVAEVMDDVTPQDGVVVVKLKTKPDVPLPSHVNLAFKYPDPLGGTDRILISPKISVSANPNLVVERVTPETVVADGTPVVLGLSGKNLKTLFATNVTGADITVTPPSINGKAESLTQADDGVVFKYTPPSTVSQPTLVVFKITYTLNNNTKSLTTPPMLLLPKGEKRQDITLTIKDGPTGKTTDKTLTWPASVDADLVRKFLDGDEDGKHEANVTVNVTATENKK